MTIDSEAQALIQRLQDIEDRILSDEKIEESIYTSIITLEKIFGEDSIFSELIGRFKARHETEDLREAIKKSIKKSKASIEEANAFAIFPMLGVNKNSVLMDFLVGRKKLKSSKLREFP